MSASYQVTDGVAVISLDNPPVNGLGQGTRAGIVEGIQKAQADAAVQAVVIIGAGKVFCGGADIREFGSPKAFAEPNLHVTIEAVERSAKPVVAAINGVALGGGLELALACRHRVASATARLGLPEVRLGLLPGAGGTQRLPRLIGVAPALALMLGGEPIDDARDIAVRHHQHARQLGHGHAAAHETVADLEIFVVAIGHETSSR